MSGPRHISEFITGWLDDYEEKHVDPFNLPDAIRAAELAAKEEAAKKEHRDMNDVIARHLESNGDAT